MKKNKQNLVVTVLYCPAGSEGSVAPVGEAPMTDSVGSFIGAEVS